MAAGRVYTPRPGRGLSGRAQRSAKGMMLLTGVDGQRRPLASDELEGCRLGERVWLVCGTNEGYLNVYMASERVM